MSKEQEKQMQKYCEEHCTSGCGKDIDCPHEEQFMEMNNIEE